MQVSYEKYKELIDNKLNTYFADESLSQKTLCDSMKYSLVAGGKRIRAILVLEFCRVCGGNVEDALDFAASIEMLHTYSLIHDDLPCMDNDTLRRGKPTNHVIYGETVATLAGDALQAFAFETLLNSKLDAEKVKNAALVLAKAAGYMGICGGQYLDIDGEDKKLSLEQISEIHSLKTSSMIEAACVMGCIAGGGTTEQISAASDYAKNIGLAFQIEDDLLDLESTTEKLGKPVGSDLENRKSTFALLFGKDECVRIIEEKTMNAVSVVRNTFEDSAFLCEFAEKLAKRTN